MYREDASQILQPHEFFLPFGGHLNPKNRWCRMALQIPWAEMERQYVKKLLNLGRGRKAYSVRMALGALLIAQLCGYTDERLAEELMENPYMQYFLGLSGFTQERLFDPSLMVYFRRRLSGEPLERISEMVAACEAKRRMEEKAEKERKRAERAAKRRKDPPDGDGGTADETDTPKGEQIDIDNLGEMILDATCVPADIHFPTDLRLLSEAREWTERCIDRLHEPDRGIKAKPRTYRQAARKRYLNISKNKKARYNTIRKGIRQQLQYLARNLRTIEAYEGAGRLNLLSEVERERLGVCRIVHEQQHAYYRTKKSPPHRIVSLHMPFVRPIKRGKAGAETEFGLKLAVSVVEGMVFIERASFDNFNEGTTLMDSVERYKERFGHYPQAILADQIYRNRENLDYCKKHHIRLSGKPLGRPRQDPLLRRLAKAIERADAAARNAVEGKIGEGKRANGLDRVYARREDTFLAVVYAACLGMNLRSILRVLLRLFQQWFLGADFDPFPIAFAA